MLGPAFGAMQAPEPLPQSHWVARSTALAHDLGLDPRWLDSAEALAAFSGDMPQEGGSTPFASVYAGHQFGHWAGQLGDGRALLLGELADRFGVAQEVALKGSGHTPFSRSGDGRAVLRSSVREFLASEAMHGLGIPTTRALCITGSPLPVWREQQETAAVVTRVAPSFVRFGHFEYFSHLHRPTPADAPHAALRQLTDWVIDRHFPDCAAQEAPQRYANLLRQVTTRTATLMAHWQAVGFCHGVMNTDNMSVLGLTLDYGPFQFMDRYNPARVCNHSDTQGRYAFEHQPAVAHWNLYCLGQALLPLLGDPDLALAALEHYQESFDAHWLALMRAKLGLDGPAPGDRELIIDALALLQRQGLDHTRFWRHLSHWVAQGAQLDAAQELLEPGQDPAALQGWLERYRQRLGTTPWAQVGRTMLERNPKYILRNHLAEEAIRRAHQGDFQEIARLLHVLQRPYDEHPDHEHYAAAAPAWAAELCISCSS